MYCMWEISLSSHFNKLNENILHFGFYCPFFVTLFVTPDGNRPYSRAPLVIAHLSSTCLVTFATFLSNVLVVAILILILHQWRLSFAHYNAIRSWKICVAYLRTVCFCMGCIISDCIAEIRNMYVSRLDSTRSVVVGCCCHQFLSNIASYFVLWHYRWKLYLAVPRFRDASVEALPWVSGNSWISSWSRVFCFAIFEGP